MKAALADWALSPEQAGLLEQLASSLSPDQLVWVIGYLAGRRAAAAPAVAVAPAAVSPAPEAGRPPSPPTPGPRPRP